jgi:hypothetical protein
LYFVRFSPAFMSVKGGLCMMSRMTRARAIAWEGRWRRCSIGTGLRFCGMIDDVCTKALGTDS